MSRLSQEPRRLRPDETPVRASAISVGGRSERGLPCLLIVVLIVGWLVAASVYRSDHCIYFLGHWIEMTHPASNWLFCQSGEAVCTASILIMHSGE